jgi:uncharacterized membrane protein YbhN (UPF0104 family)
MTVPTLVRPLTEQVAPALGRSDLPVLRPSRLTNPRSWGAIVWVTVLIVTGGLGALAVVSDTRVDLIGLAHLVGQDALHLRWQYGLIVVVLAGLHYLATAVSARAAAGLRLRLGEVLVVQLSAAAANRITPAGLGGSALNVRFFTRRGLRPSAAIGAVTTLSVLGAIADFFVLILLVGLGGLLGLSGAGPELLSVLSRLPQLLSAIRSPWILVALIVVGSVAVAIGASRGTKALRRTQFWSPLGALIQRPSALLTLMSASGMTTLILGFAFIASTAMVPGPRPSIALGALLVAFMLGAAAGSSMPIPAGVGTTEGALIAVLVSAHIPISNAVEMVMIFRLLTFWLPAVIGLFAMRYLLRRGAI